MTARAFCLVSLVALAACGNKTEAPATTSAAASAKPVATAKATASATATAVTTASASASAPASGSADAEPAGAVHIHLESVKVATGKSDTAEKTLKANMLKLRTTCVTPALKTTPTFEGTLRMSLEVGADGKIAKASPKVVVGKVPDDLQKCAAKFYEEKVQLEAGKAKIEATILMGPKVGDKP